MRRAEVLGVLSDRPFRLVWLAATTSAVGSAFVPVALAFAVLSSGGTATSLGVVLLAGTVAGLVSFLIAGVWADRLSRRNLMLAADAVRLAVEAGTAALLLTHQARIWELALASVLMSIATAFEGPASTGLVAQVLPAGRLQQGNSLLTISNSAASVVGPALSGVLVAAAGPGWAFGIDSLSFAGSGAFLLAMASLGRPQATREHFLTELMAGWREMAGRNWAWSTLIGNAFSNMAFGSFMVLGPVLAVQRLGGARGWGVVTSCFMVGTLAGGLAAMWVKARRPISFGMAVTMLTALPLLALAARLPLPAICAGAILGGAGGTVLNTNWDTAIQQLVPNELLARFRSYDYLLAFIAIPVGLAVAGPLSAAFGADPVLLGAGVVALVANFVPAVLPSVRRVVRHEDGSITGPGSRYDRAGPAPALPGTAASQGSASP